MNELVAFIREHPVEALAIWTVIITGIHHAFDAAVDSLEPPEICDGRRYRFIYNFCQKFAGNYRKKP